MNGSESNKSSNNLFENEKKVKSSMNHRTVKQTKLLEPLLIFLGKTVWPLMLLAVFLLYDTEVKTLFDRLISFNLAGQEFSFSESLKQPVSKFVSIDDITDKSIDIRKDTLATDAVFQVCKKYVVLRTSEIPEDKNAQAKQMFQIIEVIRSSLVCGEFLGLIVLDEKDLYVGSFYRSFFLETVIPWSNLIGYPADGLPSDIASWLKSKSIFGLALEYPETRIDVGEGFRFSVGQNQSVAETMEILLASGKDFIAVVDNYGRFQGTVTRTRLLDQLLLALLPKQPAR